MGTEPQSIMGWDIGGANLKAALITIESGRITRRKYHARPFEVWKESHFLSAALQDIGRGLNWQPDMAMGVTMTAELADAFRSKREGVLFVLNEMEHAFGTNRIKAFNLAGEFQPLSEAARDPLAYAATNWIASARLVAQRHPDCLFMDIGSTTSDIIPIAGGEIKAKGRTDTQRLARGELVYSGMLRTNPNTIIQQAPIRGQYCRVTAEYFTIMADVYRILGRIAKEDYTCASPDGRSSSLEHCRERLARLPCADAEMLKPVEIEALAAYLADKQLQQVCEAMHQVVSALDGTRKLPVVAVGPGSFIAMQAARRLGLDPVELAHDRDNGAPASLPALAVAVLLAGVKYDWTASLNKDWAA